MELDEVIERIDLLKAEIDKLKPISPETEDRIFQKFRLDWNYHSNNIEGNSLTFGETRSFLLHGITAEGKPLKDHLDLKGHNEAILLVEEVIKQKRPLTETFIRELHEIILHEPYERPAITADGTPTVKKISIGKYKTTPNHVKTSTGETFFFATPEETPAMMNDLMDWYINAKKTNVFHPLILAAKFHYDFIRIHPFDDGNGRMARIIMNLILMSFGFPPVIIKTDDKANYFKALQQADGGEESFFYAYIGEQVIHSEELYLRGAKGENIEEPDDIDKKITLLKTRLKEESDKIIYHDSTKISILKDSIIPLLNTIGAKINQFNELFFSSTVLVINILNEKHYNSVMRTDNILKTSSVLNNFFNNNYVNHLIFKFNWKDFTKTDNLLFDVKVEFAIKLDKFEFEVIIDDQESVKIFYHKRVDEKKFQKIANLLASIVLAEIEKNLEE